MTKVLIIKTSSLGDIIHTLPALTDAARAIVDIQFDWVVEEAFQEIPHWHPNVRKVIPVALRRWRKNIISTFFSTKGSGKEWQQFKQQINSEEYDLVIDAQGLLKSAFLTRYANTKGKIYGLDKNSAREGLVEKFYDFPLDVDKKLHAVERVRLLFAQSLSYSIALDIDYGIKNYFSSSSLAPSSLVTSTIEPSTLVSSKSLDITDKMILFFHGTTWASKHWPEAYWKKLAQLLVNDGFSILLPWGNEAEKQRAEAIAEFANRHVKTAKQSVHVLDKMSLNDLAKLTAKVTACISVDTGLAHLAAALDVPNISLFGPTNPILTRPYGQQQTQLQVTYECKACLKKTCNLTFQGEASSQQLSPACFSSLAPQTVLQSLYNLIESTAPESTDYESLALESTDNESV